MKNFWFLRLLLFTSVAAFATDNAIKSTAEIRAYIQDIHVIQLELINLGAVLKDEYAFTDYIYQHKSSDVNLHQEYVRLRVYEKTNWPHKSKYLLVHKKASQGLTGELSVKKYFDSFEKARKELEQEYMLVISFYRTGWEYSLNDNCIFVEDIQYLRPTIEIVASDKKYIDDLFSKISIEKVIEHSIPHLVYQQNIEGIK